MGWHYPKKEETSGPVSSSIRNILSGNERINARVCQLEREVQTGKQEPAIHTKLRRVAGVHKLVGVRQVDDCRRGCVGNVTACIHSVWPLCRYRSEVFVGVNIEDVIGANHYFHNWGDGITHREIGDYFSAPDWVLVFYRLTIYHDSPYQTIPIHVNRVGVGYFTEVHVPQEEIEFVGG